jgi:hypothetical protein
MSYSSSKLINAFETRNNSQLMIYYHSFFELIFPVYYIMLKYYFYSFYKELFFLIFEYCTLLIAHFNKQVSISIILLYSSFQFGIHLQ